jgi:hypothetical protein
MLTLLQQAALLSQKQSLEQHYPARPTLRDHHHRFSHQRQTQT